MTATGPTAEGTGGIGAPGDVLDELTRMLVTIMGEEILLTAEITAETGFEADLGIESIEMVALGELVRERYGTGVDMAALFAERDIDDLMALTVGDLVDHVMFAPGPSRRQLTADDGEE
jgi:acyl carrier protein